MTDFHMHVLPGMDDGSRDVPMSLAMLQKSAAYGVDTVAATSHFYAEENSITRFLERRQSAYHKLQEAMAGSSNLPKIRLGAEVLFFSGISTEDRLEDLCLEGTDLLLLEMPFVPWPDRVFREVETIQRSGLQIVAAHIERYMDIQPKRTMDAFLDLDTFIQCNGEFFLNRRTARQAFRMFKQGKVQFLGSDAHNLTSRAPNLGEAVQVLEKKFGGAAVDGFFADVDYYMGEGKESF